MASEVSHDGLNISGRKHTIFIDPWLFLTHPSEVVSALHERPHQSTHYNTIRAKRIPPSLAPVYTRPLT